MDLKTKSIQLRNCEALENCSIMEGFQKEIDEASGLQIHLEQLHQELLTGIETLEVKTNWILSMSSDLTNSKEATTKLISYQDSLKKTKQNLKGFNLQPFPEIVINPKLEVIERKILSEVNHPLEVDEVTIGNTFLVKSEPSEAKEEEIFDQPIDYEELIEAEVKVELPQITHELRHGRTIFTEGGSEVIIAEPGTIARPLYTENTQEIELVSLDDETPSKRKRSEDEAPDQIPSKKKEMSDSWRDRYFAGTEPSNLSHAILTRHLPSVKAILEKYDVKEKIKDAISINLSGMDSGRYHSYKNLANLAYNCVRHTDCTSQDVILEKIQIINYLTACNKDLIGVKRKESFRSNVIPPLLAPGIHVDLLLQLLENGANPLVATKNNENLFHTFLSSQSIFSMPKLFEGCVKIMQKLPDDVLIELLNSKDRIYGRTPLLKIFIKWGKIMPLSFFEAFAKAGADFSAKDPSGDSLLSLALEHSFEIEVVKKIIELGGDIHWKGEDGASLLHLAVTIGNLLAVELFLESGLSANIEDNEGLTTLDYLVFKWKAWHLNDKYIEIGKKLNQWGGEFNTKRGLDQTLLHVVAGDSTQSYELAGLNVSLLISLGFRLDGVDCWGETPLHFACRAFEAQWKRHNPTKRKFTERKYDLNEGLMGIKYLIKSGAKIVKNKRGKTPADLINNLGVPEKVKNEMKKCFVQK